MCVDLFDSFQHKVKKTNLYLFASYFIFLRYFGYFTLFSQKQTKSWKKKQRKAENEKLHPSTDNSMVREVTIWIFARNSKRTFACKSKKILSGWVTVFLIYWNLMNRSVYVVGHFLGCRDSDQIFNHSGCILHMFSRFFQCIPIFFGEKVALCM